MTVNTEHPSVTIKLQSTGGFREPCCLTPADRSTHIMVHGGPGNTHNIYIIQAVANTAVECTGAFTSLSTVREAMFALSGAGKETFPSISLILW